MSYGKEKTAKALENMALRELSDLGSSVIGLLAEGRRSLPHLPPLVTGDLNPR